MTPTSDPESGFLWWIFLAAAVVIIVVALLTGDPSGGRG